MKIYIASRYLQNKVINQKIYSALVACGFDVFLPIKININAKTHEEKLRVNRICYNELRDSDIVIGVCDFGMSVSAELGYAAALKDLGSSIKLIILYTSLNDIQKVQSEAMIDPSVDCYCDGLQDLLQCVTQISNAETKKEAE